MRYTVVVLHPESNAPVALLAGKPVPKWAKELVHDDDQVKAGDVPVDDPGAVDDPATDPADPTFDEAAAHSKWDGEKVADLKAEVDKRNADRDPEGETYIKPAEPGNKAELVDALVADDKAAAGA